MCVGPLVSVGTDPVRLFRSAASFDLSSARLRGEEVMRTGDEGSTLRIECKE